jgi:microcystin-dependent protein
MNIYLLSNNVNTYKKFKLQDGDLYMNEKRLGIESFNGGNQINIIDHSFNLSDNIDISNLYIENSLLIDICNSFNNNNNFINGDLDVCGEINVNSYSSSNDNFSGKAIFDSIELKNIQSYTNNILSFISDVVDASLSNLHSNLMIIDTKIESKNIITNNLDISNDIYSNKLNIYEKLDISNNLDICGNVHILKNIDISNDCSIYNGNLHIYKNMTIHNDISINNYNITANIIDVCNTLIVESFETNNTTLTEDQFVPVAYILTISTYTQGEESNNDTITINSEFIDASQSNLIVKDISCIDIVVSGDAQFANLIVDGSFSFNSIIENINSTNDEILITTQLDISNNGSGISLKITQGGNGDDNDVLHITSKSENIVLKIDSSGNIIFYKDLTIHGKLDICNNLIIHHNLDIYGNVDISKNLFIGGNVDICNNLDISDSLNIHGNLDICGSFNINEITIIEKDNIHFVQGDVSNTGSYYGYGTVPIGGIIMWSGNEAPYGWTLCDGNNGIPDLRGKFIMSSTYNTTITISGEDASYNMDQSGGLQTVTLEDEEIPSHNHEFSGQVTIEHSHNINNSSVGGNSSNDGGHKHEAQDFAVYDKEGDESNAELRFESSATDTSKEGNYKNDDDDTEYTTWSHSHDIEIQHETHSIDQTTVTHYHNMNETGSSKEHENLPPYYVLAFIMRIS